jgi:hypothetical protein
VIRKRCSRVSIRRRTRDLAAYAHAASAFGLIANQWLSTPASATDPAHGGIYPAGQNTLAPSNPYLKSKTQGGASSTFRAAYFRRVRRSIAFSVNWTAFAIFMVVIGGIGRIEGPIVGALIFWALNKLFSDYGTWYLLGLGALAIVVTIFFKQGLWGWAQQRWGWTLFPVMRRLKVRP